MNAIKNRTFVLVGQMGNPHSAIKTEIRKRGGKVKHKVTEETDYLVMGVIHQSGMVGSQNRQVECASRLREKGYGIRIIWPHELFVYLVEADERDQ